MTKVSVIIAAWNATNYLAEAIGSVRRQDVDAEIVVGDDGSTDATVALAQNLGAKVVGIPHTGSSAARNAAMKIMTGDYFMFLDHDDLIADGTLVRFLKEFEEDSSLQMVSAKLVDFVSPDLSQEEAESLLPRSETYGGLLTGAMLFVRSVYDTVGGFDESFITGEGVDWLLRVEKAGIKGKKMDFVAARRRLHGFNKGRTLQLQEKKDYADVLRAKLRRK